MTTLKILTPKDLEEFILDNYDPDDLLEALALTTDDLIDRFQDKIWERRYEFTEFYYEENEDHEPYES